MEQPVKHYSMGMRTRLAFAICAHVEAEILVVDEALAVGDAAFQRKCLDWIDSFRRKGTLLFVSHSPGEVRRLCNRAVWIEDGRNRSQGDPRVVPRLHRALPWRGHSTLLGERVMADGGMHPLLGGAELVAATMSFRG